MMIVVRKTLSKGRHQYFSFLPQEGCQYLKEYLESRVRNVEGQGWVPKGGLVLPINVVVDYVFNLLKIAIKSNQFRENHPELHSEIENFVKQISLYVGLSSPVRQG